MGYLRPHQEKALKKLTNGRVLYGGVGSGKTPVAVEYYKLREAPRDVYVITTARKRDEFDWQEEFYRVGVGPATGPDRGARPGTRKLAAETNRMVATQESDVPRDLDSAPQWTDLSGAGENVGVGPRTGPNRGRPAEIPSVDAGSGSAGTEAVLPQGDRVGDLGRDAGGSPLARMAGSGSLESAGSGASDGDPAFGRAVDGEGYIRKDGTSISSGSYNPEPSQGLGGSTAASEPGTFPYVLTVDSWQNIAKYGDVAGAFFIFDEQRLVGSGSWARIFLRIAKNNHWILLSATPGDTWMDYIPIFVANNFYKNRTDFKRRHVVYNTFTKFPKVDRYIDQGRLLKLRNEILVQMPYERHTKRRHVVVPLAYDKQMLDRVLKDRWNVYTEEPLIDIADMFRVARRVVNSDPSRLEMVRELWKNHPRLIVFYNFNYELESLRSLSEYYALSPQSKLDSSVDTKSLWNDGDNSKRTTSIAEWNGQKHQPVPTTDRWLYLAQYTAAAEAWNCITTDAMIMYSKNYSWKIMEQSYGRIDRLNTLFKDLWYYGFTTDSFVDKAIQRSLDAKETFNERKYSKIFDG